MKVLAMLLASGLVLSPANAREALVDRLQFYTQWDDDYLYFAAHCDDVNIVGTHDGLAQPVYLDDDIEVFLQTTEDPTPGLTDTCWWLAMSVAQGVVFRQGDPRGAADTWNPAEPSLLGARFRQAVTIDGTRNDPTDLDRGWVVEAAIPWRALRRGKPEPNETWGFNVVRHLRGETNGRFSYVFHATPPETQVQPIAWGSIAFRDGAAGEAWIEPGVPWRMVCPRAQKPAGRNQNPLIDGQLEPGEWPLLHRTDVALEPDRIAPMPHQDYPPPPEVAAPLPEGCTFEAPAVPVRAARERWYGERLAMASYRLDYQDDPRQPGGAYGVRSPDGALKLALQPSGGLGPWFSAARVDWHREQLLSAAAIGFDHLLVLWPGGVAADSPRAESALASLVTAAVQLRAEGRHVPGLAPLLTAAAIDTAAGPGRDLTQPVAQAALWRAIRSFYARVPNGLRAACLDGPRRSLLVGLSPPPDGLRATDSFLAAAEEYSRRQLGRDLLWIGSASWGRRPLALDAVVTLDAGLAAGVFTGRRLTCASVGPGYDDTRSASLPEYRGRRGIATFREGLVQVLEAKPQWLWLQSFNDYEHGDAVAETVEYGRQTSEAARIGTMQFNAPNDQAWVAHLRQVAMPPQLVSGRAVEVPLVVQNAGLRDWRTDDAVQLAYRWYTAEAEPALKSDGTPATDDQGRPLLRHRVLAETSARSGTIAAVSGSAMATSIAILPVDDRGKALPAGRYRLRFDLSYKVGETVQPVLGDDGQPLKNEQGRPQTKLVRQERWFGFEGDSPHDLDVEVVAPQSIAAAAGTVLDAPLPGRVAAGQAYRVMVQVRNEGAQTWDPGVRLAARFERRPPLPNACSAEPPPVALSPWMVQTGVVENLNLQRREAIQRAGGDPAQAPQINAVGPGEVVELRCDLKLVDDQGRPLPTGEGDLLVNLALVDAAGRLLPSDTPWQQVVELAAGDPGVVFTRIDAPELYHGGQEEAAEVTVENRGSSSWPAGSRWLTWRWYTWDGLELPHSPAPVPLPREVKPGAATTLAVKLSPPREVGLFRLLFELQLPDGRFARQGPSMRARETVPQMALVVRGETRPVDLTEAYNARIASFESDPAEARLDERGRSFPAELLPPFSDSAGSGLYPSGYLLAGGPDGLAQRQIAFWLRPTRTEATAVQPAGQRLALVPGRFRRLHLLCFATADGVSLALKARLSGTPNTVDLAPVAVPRWDGLPSSAVRVGLMSTVLRGPTGALPGARGYLHHVSVTLDPNQPIDALLLPSEPRVRLVAATLEEVPAAVGPPAPSR